MQMLHALWAYRNFIVSSVLREFRARYRESLLGGLWSVAQPLTMIVIYTVIFGQLLKPTLAGQSHIPYAFSIYLCAGVMAWNLFSEMLGRLSRCFLDNGNLIKKANFPRACLPVIVALSALINFSILLALLLIFLIAIGHWPGWPLLALAPLLALQLLFTLGLGVLLGTLNVFFRDVGQMTQVVLQFWFWLTPIVYTQHSLSPRVQTLLQLNPLTALLDGYRRVLLEHSWPDWSALWPLLVISALLLLFSGHFFLRRVGEMVDEL